MNMTTFAENELNRLIKPNGDNEMQLEMNKDILEIVGKFANQGHSGFSAAYALGIIQRLLSFKPIQPLTGEPNEWEDVQPWDKGDNTQQNLRCSSVFRNNFDNSTAYDINGKIFSDDGGDSWFTNIESRVPVIFPYTVPDKPEKVYLVKEGEYDDD